MSYHRIETPNKKASIDYHLTRLNGQIVRLGVLQSKFVLPEVVLETLAALKSHADQLTASLQDGGYDVT